MPDVDFSQMSWRSFEQMTQALAIKALGTGVSIFGDGPDGGREATFNGSTNHATTGEQWSGYIVIQAKFHQREEDEIASTAWLVDEIRKELKKFANKDAGLTTPEYYVLVTNVRLSSFVPTRTGKSKARKSGHDRVNDAFARYGKPLGIKGFDVWHGDKLRSMLDNAPEIRQSYQAWITPHDIIFKLIKNLDRYGPKFESIIRRSLIGEMRKQRDAKLQQAGHSGDAPTALDAVFVDLPIASQVKKTEEGGERPIGIVEYLVEAANRKLDPTTLMVERRAALDAGRAFSSPNKFLILGGPGQGKSTVSQFLAQIFRARCLADQNESLFPEGTYGLIGVIQGAAKREAVQWAGPRRFPLRLELPKFADILRSNGNLSLLDYIWDYLQVAANANFHKEDVRLWLAEYPWLLVLDGLDEVPPSSNRGEVLEKIEDFWGEVAELGADVMVAITTRPQGYNDDLGSQYTVLELDRLSVPVAIKYAERLANAKIADVSDRASVLRTFREASSNPTTERLLISPLQVAIMIALIESRGEAPSDRWQLFDGYYKVISNRERSKPDEISRIFRKRTRDIDIIHQLVGICLQTESEVRGSADAYVSADELAAIVGGHLRSEGASEGVDQLVGEIVTAATERLAFLNGKVEGQITFDVRSLQEYMAAARIMSGPAVQVQKRLRKIANKSHWKHVFQIASSKAFSVPDAEHFRDTILQICTEQNNPPSEGDHVVMTGSALALALLEDGIGYDQLNYLRSLTSLALQLVSQGPSSVTRGLIDVAAEPHAKDVVLDALTRGVAQPGSLLGLGSWFLCFELASRSLGWAADFALAHWPSDPIHSQGLMSLVRPEALDVRIKAKMDEYLDRVNPALLYEELRSRIVGDADATKSFGEAFPEMGRAISILEHDAGRTCKILNADAAPRLEISPVRRKFESALLERHLQSSNLAWQLLARIEAFNIAPSIASGAAVLQAMLGLSGGENPEICTVAPWPVFTAYTMRKEYGSESELIEAFNAGSFGNPTQWELAEAVFEKDGLTADRLAFWVESRTFIQDDCRSGFPKPRTAWLTRPDKRSQSPVVDQLIEAYRETRSSGGPVKDQIETLATFVLEFYSPSMGLLKAADVPLLVNGSIRDLVRPQALCAFDHDELDLRSFVESLRGLPHGVAIVDRLEPSVRTLLRRLLLSGPDELLLWTIVIADAAKDDHWDEMISKSFPQDVLAEEIVNPVVAEAVAAAQFMQAAIREPDSAICALLDERVRGHGFSAIVRFSRDKKLSESQTDFIQKLYMQMGGVVRANSHWATQLVRMLNAHLANRQSDLHNRAIWCDLGLESYVFDVVEGTN